MKKISIIGAGPGGLAAGMLLASRGYTVTLFEKNNCVGGRSQAVRLNRYRFDLGPTALMHLDNLQALFTNAGLVLEDFLELISIDPLYHLIFKDKIFRPSRHRDLMHAEMERLFPAEINNYERFMHDEPNRFNHIASVMQNPFQSWINYFNPKVLKTLYHASPFRSVYKKLKGYFKDETLIHALSFQSKSIGLSAWKAPSLFTMLSYLEHTFGLYYVKGGLSNINEAMASAIKTLGGTVHLNSPVAKLVTEKKTVVGLVLEDGTMHKSDYVIANADFAYFTQHLLDERRTLRKAKKKLTKMRFSMSTYMMYLGLDTCYELPPHTVVFANDYARSVKTMTEKNTLDTDITVYVHNPSIIDKTLAPAGHSALYIMVPVPNNDSRINWESYKVTFKATILKRLQEKLPLANIEAHIVEEKIITPIDWERDHHVYKGAVFNLAHTFNQLLYFRPHNTYRPLKNLYIVGGGTHPGSGLPNIYQSARITSDLIIKQHSVKKT